MTSGYVLSDYIEQAMDQADYDKLEDGAFSGWISACPGVIARGATLRECERGLRSALEEWILAGLRLGYFMPVVANIDLNEGSGSGPLTEV